MRWISRVYMTATGFRALSSMTIPVIIINNNNLNDNDKYKVVIRTIRIGVYETPNSYLNLKSYTVQL